MTENRFFSNHSRSTIRNYRGFTLIELMIVLGIVALLAGIIGVNSRYYVNRARDARIREWLSRARAAQASYIADQAGIPDNINELIPDYISSIPDMLTGSQATVKIVYNAETGVIGLQVTDGELLDFTGNAYEEY